MENEVSLTKSPIGDILRSFASQIDSLRQALPMTMMLLQMHDKDTFSKLREFEDQHCSVELEGSNRHLKIPFEHYSKWNRLKHRYDQGHIARKLVPRSLFVSLVSQYDAFLGKLLRLIFLAKPEILNASKRELAFAELVEFPSIEAAREYIVMKEIETVIRMSHSEQFKWMENRFDMVLTKFDNWPAFVEITQRRNLFVHVDGLVTKQYVTECQNSKAKNSEEVKEGESLGVPQKYFEDACSCMLEVGVKLAHVLWRKLIPDQLQSADANLNELAYDLIDRKEYPLAIVLLKFAALENKKHHDELRKLMFLVNLAQAYAWNGESDNCKRILDGEDWSAKGDEFKLAEAVLREEWDRAASIVIRIGNNGPVSEIDYRDWPLFKRFRSRPEFLKAYEDVFGKTFTVSIESDSKATEDHDVVKSGGGGQVEDAKNVTGESSVPSE